MQIEQESKAQAARSPGWEDCSSLHPCADVEPGQRPWPSG